MATREEKHKERIQRLKEKSQCVFPDCEETNVIHTMRPICVLGEHGQIVMTGDEESSMQFSVPICFDHLFLAEYVGIVDHGNEMKQEDMQIHAPFYEISIAERVIEGYVMSGKMKKLMEDAEKAEGDSDE